MCQRLLLSIVLLGAVTTTFAYQFGSITSGIIGMGTDLIKGKINKTQEIIGKIPTFIPSTSTILEYGKEALLGLPFKVFYDAINKVCLLALAGNLIQSKYVPDLNEMSYVMITSNDTITVPLLEPQQLWDHPSFDYGLNTTLIITGWDFNEDDDSFIDTMYEAYKFRDNQNFIVVDVAKFIGSLYTWFTFDTEEIGKHIGNGLANLTGLYPRENIHVIGHSLGSQIAGAVGRYYHTQTNELLPRITALDPARPCLKNGDEKIGLHRGDAEFIDVIHTNNGALGAQEALGDVDFYPNGKVVLQPGCLTIICSHMRAWKYYAETVYPGNEDNFMAVQDSSIISDEAEILPGNSIPMGDSVPNDAEGEYFLKTRATSPFGKNSQLA